MKFYIAIFILTFSFLSCIKNAEKKESGDETFIKNEAIPIDTLAITQIEELKSIDIKDIVNKNFANVFKTKRVSFNDRTTFDISKPLVFEKTNHHSSTFYIGDNIKPIEEYELDSNGVVNKNGVYHPTEIGKVSLKAINNFKKTKSEESKLIFLNHLIWVEDNFHQIENYGFWIFLTPAPLYKLDAGWTSSFSHGLLLNVFLEAYHLTKDEKYLVLIEKALKAYVVPVENGGFMRHWDTDELWFEEYNTSRPSRVLNGTIYGLEGVYNVYRDLYSDLALKILESGIDTIKNHLEDYDAKYTSRYSLADWKNEVSQEHYHQEHVIQLLWLYKVSGDPIFKKYAKIFLENDKGTFMTESIYNIKNKKIASVNASHSIDSLKHGPLNLTDEIWAWGNFWSSHKSSSLIINFGEKRKNINAITLYHINEISSKINFKLYSYNEKNKDWEYVQQFISHKIKDKTTAYNITRKYETFIEHYKIFEELNTQKVKIVFETNSENIIAIRELNFNFDRTKDLDYVIKKVEERFLEIQN